MADPTTSPCWTASVLHEDEDLVLQHLVRTPAVETLVVTFDPLAVSPGESAFGTGLLETLPMDRLAVRRKHEHYFQPVSRQAFSAIVAPLLSRYRLRLAYASSLGAYAALYYLPGLVEHVVAISPRNTCHPVYGSRQRHAAIGWRHQRFDPRQPFGDAPTLIYDPLDPIDGRYVAEEIAPAFPQARLLPLRFAGHPATTFLAEVGHLNLLVRALLTGTEPPPLDRSRRKRSAVWLRSLSLQCTRRGKPRWGRGLALQALEVAGRSAAGMRALIRAELALDRLGEAQELITRCAAEHPREARHLEGLKRELERRRAPPPGPWERLRRRLGRWWGAPLELLRRGGRA